MKLFKTTDNQDITDEKTGWGQTTKWAVGKTHKAKTGHFIQANLDPILAYLSNRQKSFETGKGIHLWEAEGEPLNEDQSNIDKLFAVAKCNELTTIKQIDLPKIPTETLITVGIRCVLKVYHDPTFAEWALVWINGSDRTNTSAEIIQKGAKSIEDTAKELWEKASADKDHEEMKRNGVLMLAAQAAQIIVHAVFEYPSIGDKDAFRSAVAFSMTRTFALDAVVFANMAFSQLCNGNIDLLKILAENQVIR